MSGTLSHNRLPLPASSSAFDLPASSSPSSINPDDGLSPFMLHQRRRPSLLNPKLGHLSLEKRHHSPLSSSFKLRSSRRRKSTSNGEDSESDRDSTKMWISDRSASTSSESSRNATPPQQPESTLTTATATEALFGLASKPVGDMVGARPSTPPRSSGFDSMEIVHRRRLSLPIKFPRVLSLLSESRPDENELKSEAQFQRLLASYAGNPLTPKTPRAPSDRGKYPEEAGDEEEVAVQSDDDDELCDGSMFGYGTTTTEAINISRRGTPAQSLNGDDIYSWNPGSPAGSSYMDVDPVFSFGSPGVTPTSGPSSWRYTPPSTSSAVRSNKRKHDDRYDPYPAAKRRAVSPSMSTYLRGSPRISIPVSIPISVPNSSSTSPVITQMQSFAHPNFAFSRPMIGSPGMSSPTMRASVGLLASPILRPLAKGRREGDVREVENTGESLGSISL
ncbi:hypothetical protein BJ322DRAFT_678679 [Thelephora terrestris]|uniref:Uncharacterized protein n=1 Tax=Thelephora terrestris TaxID=56493 RepID=A0A9P6L8J0_9AGAM|nr:hypothetical protein BJ322DRAFT_678679 [Thelephora terrestris]